MKVVSDRLGELEPALREIDEQLDTLLYEIPNIPDPATPIVTLSDFAAHCDAARTLCAGLHDAVHL